MYDSGVDYLTAVDRRLGNEDGFGVFDAEISPEEKLRPGSEDTVLLADV